MTGPDPAEFGWWLASRAAGVVALLCIAFSVGLGLAMAGRTVRKPWLMALHQQTALIGLVAIAVHGITLLGDKFLQPSWADLAVPFVNDHARLWTGLGVTGGWLAAVLGLSYYVRHRIGPARWRSLHRATILVYVLSVAHTLGSGTDAGETWMRALLLVTGAPILFLLVIRLVPPPPARGFRRLRVAEVTPESANVTSFALEPADGRPLAAFSPGQFVTLRAAGQLRSYSLSAAPGGRRYRISVKREEQGTVSRHLHAAVGPGDVLEVGDPSGAFGLPGGSGPVVLIGAGIGATPLLSILEATAGREVWWIHSTRSGSEHAFREEVRQHLARLPGARSHVRYTRPAPGDRLGRDYDAGGRLTAEDVLALGVPADAAFRLCGPPAFVDGIVTGLRAAGVPDDRIDSESFGGPAAPAAAPAVAFARSGVTTTWDGAFASLLELAEANDVPAASGCRMGACQGCRADVVSGSVRHEPEPPAAPPPGSALLCCARPEGDVVLDV